MGRAVNALEVHRRALALGIGVSPGPLFSPKAALQNFLRLNCANEPTPQLLDAVAQIGKICHELAKQDISNPAQKAGLLR